MEAGLTFTSIFMDLHTFGTSLDRACCLNAIAVCPAVHGQAARRAMGTAVVRVIAFAGIVIGMKPSLAGAHAAFAALARAIRPARDFIGTDGIMAATVLGIISFAALFERMQPCGAGIGNTCLVDACSGFPAFHLIGTFYSVFATVVRTVFLADYIIVVFIGFAVCGAAAAIKACFGFFTCNKIFAVFICAAVCV